MAPPSIVDNGSDTRKEAQDTGWRRHLALLRPRPLARKYAYQALLIEEFAPAGTEVRFLKGPKSDTP
jgi:hypothetical protein